MAINKNYRLLKANLVFLLNKAIFHPPLNNRFKRYKPIDLNRGEITVILLNQARDQTYAALQDGIKSITKRSRRNGSDAPQIKAQNTWMTELTSRPEFEAIQPCLPKNSSKS